MEGKPVEKIDSYVELEQYPGSVILPIRKSIQNNIYWKSKYTPRTLGEAMKKGRRIVMKHIYATGEIPNKRETLTPTEIIINEVDSPQRPGDYSHRRWRNRESSEISPNQGKSQRQPWRMGGSSKISLN